MDMSLLASAATSVKAALDVGTIAIAARDAAKRDAALLEIRDQLLQTQQSLLTASIHTMQLVQELAEAKEEARKLKAAAEERGRYSLVEITPGNFAYQAKVDVSEAEQHAGYPSHYVCQPCFDKGVKAVLGLRVGSWSTDQVCPVCEREINIPGVGSD